MANHLYGYTGATNQYVTADPSSYRYLASDPSSTTSNLYAYPSTVGTASTLWPGPPGVDVNASSVESIYAGLKRPSSEALYHQSLLGTHNTIGQSEAWYSANPLVKRPKFASSLPVYPQRPGEKDCAHYMLTRTCKFGDACIFDHPLWVPEGGIPDWKEVPVGVASESLPERPGAPDCPYFLKTLACKFGPRCRFNHPKEKVTENNDGSLPERPSEPPCVFYMKTGVCKFGSTCKFHHPRDISIPNAGAENGHGGQIDSTTGGTNGNLTASVPLFTPAMLHNSKGLPIRVGEADCPFYLKTGSCKYGATCRYNHPERYAFDPSSAIVSTPVGQWSYGYATPAASVLQTVDPRITQTTLGLAPTLYPQRPGQTECDHYMKTGECMFGERCKFNHPLDRTAHLLSAQAQEAQQNSVKLTLAGLPRREGAVNCPYYMKTGACKYGATCKFDHPPPGEVMASATTTTTTGAGEEAKDGQ